MSAAAMTIARKAFGATEILRDIRLSIADRETVALLGPSGVGKTTLLRILAGLDRNFEGSVDRPERLAMVFQEPTLLPWRNALDNIVLVTGIDPATAGAAIEEVGLAGKAALYPGQLSLGQRRRLALARALASRPQLLIMDEPFASLDPDRAAEMIGLGRTLIERHGIATLFVTHSEWEAEQMATRVLRLSGQPASLVEE